MTLLPKTQRPDLLPDVHACCGCGACAAVCPHDAISMFVDDKGFLYPKINEELCVCCLLCEKVCAFKADMINQQQ